VPAGAGVGIMKEQYSRSLQILLGVCGLVLLIACANVANLLLARTVARSREMAIRTALGASRARTVAQLLAETFVLTVFGAVAGLLLAKAGIVLFNASTVSLDLPLWFSARLDPAVMLFVALGAVLTALLAGTLPALRASKRDINELLTDESRGSSGMRVGRATRVLVVAQLAFSCGLLVAGGLMIRTIVNVARFDYGFNTANIFTARLGLFAKDYPTPAAQLQFYDRARERVAALPGVRGVSFTSDVPGRGSSQMQRLSVDGVAYPTDQDHPRARRIVIAPGYFDVFDTRPVSGRSFTDADRDTALPVAIVNQRFVQRFMGGADPIGRRVRLGDDAAPWRTVVGVGNITRLSIQYEQPHEAFYVPFEQEPVAKRFGIFGILLYARGTGDAVSLVPAVQRIVGETNPAGTLPDVTAFTTAIEPQIRPWRLGVMMFGLFGATSLVLAVVGLYGVLAFRVNQRSREIGVRVALGATRTHISRLVLSEGLRLGVLGVAIGLVAALTAGRALATIVFGVSPRDPLTLVLTGIVLLVVAAVASALPAWRAARLDPMRILRDL